MQKIRKTKTVLILMIASVSFLTVISAIFAFKYFREQKINVLGQHATSFAIAIGAEDIYNLIGNESDLSNPSYISLKDKLTKLREFNSDTRFTYLMGQNEEDIFFYADSEDPDSPDYSPPGQVYDEASPVLKSVFSTSKIQTEVGTDRWGKWLSVMAPVIDYQTNQVVAMVGFDIPYNVYLNQIVLFTLLPISIGIIILIILLAAYFYVKKDDDLMRIRSEYFAIAAHDLRTPLTGIKFAMGTLKKTASETAKPIFDQISQSTENMLVSVNELLDSSSVETNATTKLQLSNVNVVGLIQKNLQALNMSIKEKKLTVNVNSPVELLINGDADKLHRVFANLLSNAIKYSKASGTVKVAAKKINNQVVVTIKDSGIGVPMPEQEKIFNGYFRASNAQEFTKQGTGLGLYYVKNIVELHKGTIKLNSAPNKGTEITLNFPLVKS